jgi:hypothetical protein
MERRSVFYYLILSVLALFVFFVAARKPFAANGQTPDETRGCLTAPNRAAKSPGLCPLVHTEVKAGIIAGHRCGAPHRPPPPIAISRLWCRSPKLRLS